MTIKKTVRKSQAKREAIKRLEQRQKLARKVQLSKSKKRHIRGVGRIKEVSLKSKLSQAVEKTHGVAFALGLEMGGRMSIPLKSSSKYPHPGIAAYRESEDRCIPMEG